MKTYSELIKIPTFEERLDYLYIGGKIGEETFGNRRFLNQLLYQRLPEWKQIRRMVILRDNDGDYNLDLAHSDHPFDTPVYVHHIEPITEEDILNRDHKIFDMDNLICTRFKTHQYIHFGIKEQGPKIVLERKPGDTCLW